MREIGYDKYTEYIVDSHIYYHVYSKDHKSSRKTGLPCFLEFKGEDCVFVDYNTTIKLCGQFSL